MITTALNKQLQFIYLFTYGFGHETTQDKH
jgi:hypothetical protein